MKAFLFIIAITAAIGAFAGNSAIDTVQRAQAVHAQQLNAI